MWTFWKDSHLPLEAFLVFKMPACCWHSIMECKAFCSYICCKVPRVWQGKKFVKFFLIINAKTIGNALPPNMGYFIWGILWCNFLASSLLNFFRKFKIPFHSPSGMKPTSHFSETSMPKYLSDKKKFCIMKIYKCFMVLVEGPLPWPLTRTKFQGYPSFPSPHEPSEDQCP